VDADAFWALIEQADSPGALQAELGNLSGDELASFERHYNAVFYGSYNWGLWGAAYLINGGCGDDSFDYFRAYLISLGRTVFETAVSDPDSLAGAEIATEDDEDWEGWMSPTMGLIHTRTGRYAFATDLDPQFTGHRQPTGEEWDESDLPDRFPRLAAKYG
jgi:hypothetical protein